MVSKTASTPTITANPALRTQISPCRRAFGVADNGGNPGPVSQSSSTRTVPSATSDPHTGQRAAHSETALPHPGHDTTAVIVPLAGSHVEIRMRCAASARERYRTIQSSRGGAKAPTGSLLAWTHPWERTATGRGPSVGLPIGCNSVSVLREVLSRVATGSPARTDRVFLCMARRASASAR